MSTIGIAVALLTVLPLPARDVGLTDADRARLRANLAAFRRLPPDAQDRLRQLDRTLWDEEDQATRARLWGVMERYAGWLARLPEEERQRIEAEPAGPERLRLVRDMLDRQWFAALPSAYREELANTPAAGHPALLAKWRADDRQRRQARAAALRQAEEAAVPFLAQEKFYEDVRAFAKDVLGTKLNDREKKRLESVPKNQRLNYYNLVLTLSERHGLTPPGTPEQWRRVRDMKKNQAAPAK